jgi:hypothetical protein
VPKQLNAVGIRRPNAGRIFHRVPLFYALLAYNPLDTELLPGYPG